MIYFKTWGLIDQRQHALEYWRKWQCGIVWNKRMCGFDLYFAKLLYFGILYITA